MRNTIEDMYTLCTDNNEKRTRESIATSKVVQGLIGRSRSCLISRLHRICPRSIRLIVTEILSGPINTLPRVEVGLGDVVLQGTDGAIGVFSFGGRIEIWS